MEYNSFLSEVLDISDKLRESANTKLIEKEALQMALQMQQNMCIHKLAVAIEVGLGVQGKEPAFLEAIAMQLGFNPSGDNSINLMDAIYNIKSDE